MKLLEQIDRRFDELIESDARMPENKPMNYSQFCNEKGYAIETSESKSEYNKYVTEFSNNIDSSDEIEEGISNILDVLNEAIEEKYHRFAKEETFSDANGSKRTKERYVCLDGENNEFEVEWGDDRGKIGEETFTDKAAADAFFDIKRDELGLDETITEESSSGDAGGYQTSFAFSSRKFAKKDNRATASSLKWGFEKVPTQKMHTVVKEGVEELNEASYKDYANDVSITTKQKINTAIHQLNSKLFEVEKLIRHSIRLKTETNTPAEYNKSTAAKLLKINERIVRISNQLRNYGA